MPRYEPNNGWTYTDGVWAYSSWYLKRSAEILDIFESILGDRDRLVLVIGDQAVNTYLTGIMMQANPAVIAEADLFGISPYFDEIVEQDS